MPISPAPSKPFWESKTLWINILAVGAMFIPPLQSYVSSHPTAAIDVIGAINVVLRLISGDTLEIS